MLKLCYVFLFQANQRQSETVASYLEVTSDASKNVEKLYMTTRSHQQIPKDNASQEIQALSLLNQSTQSGCITCSADSTSNGEKPKR